MKRKKNGVLFVVRKKEGKMIKRFLKGLIAYKEIEKRIHGDYELPEIHSEILDELKNYGDPTRINYDFCYDVRDLDKRIEEGDYDAVITTGHMDKADFFGRINEVNVEELLKRKCNEYKIKFHKIPPWVK